MVVSISFHFHANAIILYFMSLYTLCVHSISLWGENHQTQSLVYNKMANVSHMYTSVPSTEMMFCEVQKIIAKNGW